MYEIKQFEYFGNNLRVIIVDDKEFYFFATDVLKMLGINGGCITREMSRIPKDEKIKMRDLLRRTNDTVMTLQKALYQETQTNLNKGTISEVERVFMSPRTNLLTEAGLYRLVMRSNKPEAKRYQKWVFGEVLPALHRTGKYEMPGAKKELPEQVQTSSESKSHKVQHLREGFMLDDFIKIGDSHITLTVEIKKNITMEQFLHLKYISHRYFESLSDEVANVVAVKQ